MTPPNAPLAPEKEKRQGTGHGPQWKWRGVLGDPITSLLAVTAYK